MLAPHHNNTENINHFLKYKWTISQKITHTEPGNGLEGIAFIPDTILVKSGFKDHYGNAYTPSSKEHFGGLFFVAHQTLNSNSSDLKNHKGAIYAFELRPGGGHCSSMAQYDKNCRFINAITTNYEDSSGLEYDATNGQLYTLHNVRSHI